MRGSLYQDIKSELLLVLVILKLNSTQVGMAVVIQPHLVMQQMRNSFHVKE